MFLSTFVTAAAVGSIPDFNCPEICLNRKERLCKILNIMFIALRTEEALKICESTADCGEVIIHIYMTSTNQVRESDLSHPRTEIPFYTKPGLAYVEMSDEGAAFTFGEDSK